MPTEVFKYAGVDLRSAGLYMSLVDGFNSAPPIRGGNVLIPYQHGQRWTSKYYDERHIVLAGELFSLTSRSDFQTKLDTLKALFPITAGEQKLEVQRADGTYRYVMAEVLNTMGLQWLVFPTRSTPYSIELVASDPFWYSSVLQAGGGSGAWTLDSGIALDDSVHFLDNITTLFAQTLTNQVTLVASRNQGTIFNLKPVFTLTGGMVNPKITNTRNTLSVQILTTTYPGQVLVIDCGLRTATVQGSAGISSSQIVLGSSQGDWMRLEAGDNNLSIDLGMASPSVTYQASYSAAYL